MFAFRTMLQWRDGCELSPEKQKEFLDSAIKSITSAVSNSRNDFSFHPCKYSICQYHTDGMPQDASMLNGDKYL